MLEAEGGKYKKELFPRQNVYLRAEATKNKARDNVG